jgi:hypothetical protein
MAGCARKAGSNCRLQHTIVLILCRHAGHDGLWSKTDAADAQKLDPSEWLKHVTGMLKTVCIAIAQTCSGLAMLAHDATLLRQCGLGDLCAACPCRPAATIRAQCLAN